ncbi:MAG TPA: hypothetical protein ENI62_15485, partial [Gammaproteobacteria bacterium]|nr:hypothetical protein [Gammaproteobacteria bacterium]
MTGMQLYWHTFDRSLFSRMLALYLVLAVGVSPAYAGFASHTDILMADGQSREIEGIKIGDRVIGVNGNSNRVL